MLTIAKKWSFRITPPTNARRPQRLRLLQLEGRIAPATLTVTNTNDAGTGSLRAAIATAGDKLHAGADTIVFSSLFNTAQIIKLTTGEISIDSPVSIVGPGASLLTVTGNATSRAFNTTAALDTEPISLSGLTLASCLGIGVVGGAIVIGDESVTFTNCDFVGNISTVSGGALATSGDATITMTDCSLTNNDAQVDGGAIRMVVGGKLTMERCTISGCDAVTGNGGGISVSGKITDNATITLRNSTLSGNTAENGGAIAIESVTSKSGLIIRNSTLTLNQADGAGGGIARVSGTAIITIESTIVSGNTNATAPDISSAGTVNVDFSAIGSSKGFTVTGANNLGFGVNLKLSPLTNNGGPTNTHLPAWDSPVVGKGVNNIGVITDQRGAGFARNSGTGVDIGAVEARNPLEIVVVNTNDSGAGSLRQAILDANANSPVPDKITFDPIVFATPQVITLTSGELTITDVLTLYGPVNRTVTVSGNNMSRIAHVNIASDDLVSIYFLDLIDGNAAGPGGAVWSESGRISLFRSSIRDSVATGSGGAVFVQTDGSFDIIETVFENNQTGGNGGAIGVLNSSASLYVNYCQFVSNQAMVNGGAIGGTAKFLSVINSSVLDNSANNGGGIFIQSGAAINADIQIETTTIANNQAKTDGGGILALMKAAVTLINSTVSSNTAQGIGGGIFGGDFNINVWQSTVTGNTAAQGGGIIQLAGIGVINADSSIIQGNSAATGPDVRTTNKLNSLKSALGSLDGIATFNNQGGNLIGANIKLGPLADNGGTMLTHALLDGSPCINATGNIFGYGYVDQRGPGFPRRIGGIVDMGAIEHGGLVVTNANDSGVGSLRQAIDDANFANGFSDTITFDPVAFSTPQTILLTSGQLEITDRLTIQGPGANLVTISGNDLYRVMHFSGPITWGILSKLTIADGKSVGAGGGILNDGAYLYLSECVIAGNAATGALGVGGGIASVDGIVTLVDCQVTGNTADETGGGIEANHADLTVSYSTIADNQAVLNGGGIAATTDKLTIEHSTLSGNEANFGGGLILFGNFSGAQLNLRNSTVSGNMALNGGGGLALYTGAEPFYLQNSTITNNKAPGMGGGIISNNGMAAILLESSIVQGNFVTVGPGPEIFTSGTVSFKNSALGSIDGIAMVMSLGGNLIGQDIKLAPLGHNGGYTMTHALLPGSPCINAGSNPASLLSDQRSYLFPRVVGAAADMGAFEVQPALKVSSVNVNDGSPQRSMVTSLSISFNQSTLPLSGNAADAFQLVRQSDSAKVDLQATVAGSAVTLTFIGGAVDGASLADGRYTLTILAEKITNLDGNGDGTPGDNFVLVGAPANGLFRLFGDADGNGLVTAVDFGAFRNAFGVNGPSIFDFNGDQQTTSFDFNQFRLRYGVMV